MSFDDSKEEPLHSSLHTEFIIEAGAQAEGNGWKAFFRIERHASAPWRSRRVFLNRKFDDLEIAIQAALNEARKRIHEDLAAADIA
jgi:hypothetical protein